MPLTLPWSTSFESDDGGFTLDANVARYYLARTGTYSLRFQNNAEYVGYATQTFDLPSTAELTCWLQNYYTGGAYAYFDVLVDGFIVKSFRGPSATPRYGYDETVLTSNTWILCQVPLASGSHTIRFECSFGEINLDDVSIVATAPLAITSNGNPIVGTNKQATITRGGPTGSSLSVSLNASNSNVQIPDGSYGGSATILAGDASVVVDFRGMIIGTSTLTASASGVPDATVAVSVLAVPPVGLGGEVGWWCPSLDSAGNGTTTLTDLSGSGHDGAFSGITGSAWVADTTYSGVRCVNLNSAGKVIIGHHAEYDFERTNAFSFSGWVYCPAGSIPYVPLLSKLDHATPYRGWEVVLNDGNPGTALYLVNTWGSNYLRAYVPHSSTHPAGAWHHLAMGYAGNSDVSGVSIYWDGVLRAKTTSSNALSSTIKNTIPVVIGSRNSTSPYGNYKFDDVRILSREITPREVQHLSQQRAITGTPPAPDSSNLLTSLESYWKLDEASGSAVDAKGANTLTQVGSVTNTAGKISNARNFPGGANYFSIANNSSVQTGDIDFTFSAWVYPTSSAGNHRVACKINGGLTNLDYQLFYQNDGTATKAFSWQVFDGSASIGIARTQDNLPINNWYHLIAWHDVTNNKVGIVLNNGTPILTATSGAAGTSSAPFSLGSMDTYSGSRWIGYIDEVGFWKRLLTQAERTALYELWSPVVATSRPRCRINTSLINFGRIQ